MVEPSESVDKIRPATDVSGLNPLGRVAIHRTWNRVLKKLEIYDPSFFTRTAPVPEGFDIEEAARLEVYGHSIDMQDWKPEDDDESAV